MYDGTSPSFYFRRMFPSLHDGTVPLFYFRRMFHYLYDGTIPLFYFRRMFSFLYDGTVPLFYFRRMFPYLYISVSGLDPDAVYDVLLDILPADKRRFKFFNESWVPVGVAEPQQDNAPYVHPESPSPGSLWMARKISFARVKLTNSLESSPENVSEHVGLF